MRLVLEHVRDDVIEPDGTLNARGVQDALRTTQRSLQLIAALAEQIGLTVTAGHGPPVAETPNGVYFDEDGAPDVYFLNLP